MVAIRHRRRIGHRAFPHVFLAMLLAGWVIGCARTAPVIEIPMPEVPLAGLVSGPLPGADSTVIQDVAVTFDSTFVAAQAEAHAQRAYLNGQALIERVDSLVSRLVGPSALGNSVADPESADTTGFVSANDEARRTLAYAARAQVSQDSVLAQSLLSEAQQLFEEAVSLNPWHEEARYQLAQVYYIRANRFRQDRAWEEVLRLLRELVKLRADEHGLWAEMALALDQLGQPEASALAWRKAAEVVLDDSRLAFEPVPPSVDSVALFTYNVQAYRAFVDSRNGEGVRHSLTEAWKYATSGEETDFAQRELTWAIWDYPDFENRLAFDSLRSAAANDPLGARTGLGQLLEQLVRPSAQREARYNHALLSYDNGFEDGALDTLKALWHDVTNTLEMESDFPSTGNMAEQLASAAVIESLVAKPMPYAAFPEDLRSTYATFLYERSLLHMQEGASALAFTYLMQVVETGSQYTGRAYVDALKLARYNPEQALELESRVEAVYDTLSREDQLAYLVQIGNLYRRLGQNEKAAVILARYRALRGAE